MDSSLAAAPARGREAHRLAPPIPAALAAWLLPFALITYLGLRGGGYDVIVRSEVGIAAWWIVLLGALAGVLPVARLRAPAWVGLGLLAAFAVWTGLSLGWTESDERTVIELGKVAAYLGILALAFAAIGPGAARHAINGAAAAVVFIAAIAVLSRLVPDWFGQTDLERVFPSNAGRLHYPLNYWNALAALVAMGLPLLLAVAGSARTVAGRALATAGLPLLVLCLFLTISRGGVIAAGAGLVAFLVLAPDRAARLASVVVAGAGSVLLVQAADQRDALQDGLRTAAASAQGEELLWLALIVCAGAGLLGAGIALVELHAHRPAWARLSWRRASAGWALVVAATVAVLIAIGAPGKVQDRWDQFKGDGTVAAPVVNQEDALSRLGSLNGNGRYQYWIQARDAQEQRPLSGIGAGTFEYWWSRHNATGGGFVRDAHSLWMETLAELGAVGLALIGGFFAWVLGVAAVRCARVRGGPERALVAGAAAAIVAFAVSGAGEWIWEIAALAALVLILAAVILKAGAPSPPPSEHRWVPRAALAVIAVAGAIAIVPAMAGTETVRESQIATRDSDLVAALSDARTAGDAQPYAATPRLQEALVLERLGNIDSAAAAATTATRREPTNWRTWLVLSRLEAERGQPTASLRAYRAARSLNPKSLIFTAG